MKILNKIGWWSNAYMKQFFKKKMVKKVTSKFFSEEELQRCDPPCSLQDMKQSTIYRADRARTLAKMPFNLSCAYRSTEWDIERNRSGTGAHTTGNAIDIECYSSESRFKIIKALIEAGFNRIGVSCSFIHADDSTRLPENVIWTY